MKKNTCPICGEKAQIKPTNGSLFRIECDRCGLFLVTSIFFYGAESSNLASIAGQNKYALQGALREVSLRRKIGSTPVTIGVDSADSKEHLTVSEFLTNVIVPENPPQKIDKLFKNLELLSKGEFGKINTLTYLKDYPLAYCKDADELSWILNEMNDLGYFANFNLSNINASFVLSMKAWQRIEELKIFDSNSNQVFIACTMKPEHKHNSFAKAISRGIDSVEGFNLKAILINEKNYPETIMEKALGEIKRSRFVVVDLTWLSNSVFFEAGFCKGRGVEFIFVIKEDQWTQLGEFYTKSYLIRKYKNESELEKLIKTIIEERIS